MPKSTRRSASGKTRSSRFWPRTRGYSHVVKALVLAAVAGVMLAATGAAAPGKTRALWIGSSVYATTDGTSWRNVTPSDIRPPAAIDNVAFPGGDDGWLGASACGAGRVGARARARARRAARAPPPPPPPRVFLPPFSVALLPSGIELPGLRA